jgi:hypothetical protein
MICAHPWTQSLSGYVFTTFLHVRLTTPSDAEGLICEPVVNTHPRLVLPVCSASHAVHGVSSLKGANRFRVPSYIRPTSTSFTCLDAVILINREADIRSLSHPPTINRRPPYAHQLLQSSQHPIIPSGSFQGTTLEPCFRDRRHSPPQPISGSRYIVEASSDRSPCISLFFSASSAIGLAQLEAVQQITTCASYVTYMFTHERHIRSGPEISQ